MEQDKGKHTGYVAFIVGLEVAETPYFDRADMCVIQLLAAGHEPSDIARELDVPLESIDTFMHHLLERTNTSNVAMLVVTAIAIGALRVTAQKGYEIHSN